MANRPAPLKYRYNPRLGKPMAKVYRPWYFLFALFTVLIGIAIVACAVAIKQFDSDIDDNLFHLWVGIPLIFVAILGVIVGATKERKTIILFLIVVIIVMVVCAASACLSGLMYWSEGWQAAKKQLDITGSCSTDTAGKCVCQSITNMPSTIDCSDMDHTIGLLIAEICLSAVGFAICVAGAFLGFMSVCCGPWQYMEDYDKHYDPDFSNNYPVQHRTYPQDINFEKAHANAGFANGNDRYNHQ